MNTTCYNLSCHNEVDPYECLFCSVCTKSIYETIKKEFDPKEIVRVIKGIENRLNELSILLDDLEYRGDEMRTEAQDLENEFDELEFELDEYRYRLDRLRHPEKYITSNTMDAAIAQTLSKYNVDRIIRYAEKLEA